jgi:hypothetical protein
MATERSEPAPLVNFGGEGVEVVAVVLEGGAVVAGGEVEAGASEDVPYSEEFSEASEDVVAAGLVVGGAVVEPEGPGGGAEEVEVKGKGTMEPPCTGLRSDEDTETAAALYASMDSSEGGLTTPAIPDWQWLGVAQ